MEKFLELALTGRKKVTGNVCLTATALSYLDEELGKLDIKVVKENQHMGIFAKYTPTEGCEHSTLAISSIVFSGADDEKIKETLAIIRKAFLDSSSEASANPQHAAAYLVISFCIFPDNNTVKIPAFLPFGYEIRITNELILSLFGEDWLGIEFRYSDTVKEKLDEHERKLEEKKAAEYEKGKAAMDSLMRILGSSSEEEENE